MSQNETPTVFYEDYLRLKISVNPHEFALGIDDVGFSRTEWSNTSVRFHSPNEYLGSSLQDRLLYRIMFRLPYFRDETVLRMGFSLDQAAYRYKIAAQGDPDVCPRLVRESLLKQHDTRPRDVRRLTAGHCIALVLAHEFNHLRRYHEGTGNRFFGKRREEAEIRAYIAENVASGRRSPWAKVIKVRN